MVGQVDEDVVGRVVGAVPGEIDALAADLEGAAILERLLVRGSGRVVVAQQQPPGLLMAERTTPVSNSEDASAWSAWWWE